MSAALRLAERIERERLHMAIPGDESMTDAYFFKPSEARLLVAALRLAEELRHNHAWCERDEHCTLHPVLQDSLAAVRAALKEVPDAE